MQEPNEVTRVPPATLLVELHHVLDRLGGVDFGGECGAADLGAALAEVARAEARLAAVKLTLVAAAEAAQVRVHHGSSDTAAWAATAVGGNRPRSWGAVWLA